MRPRVAIGLLVAAAIVPSAAASAGPFRTAVAAVPSDPLAYSRVRDAGATFVRINVNWGQVAPGLRPSGFHPNDPSDPSYSWGPIDRQVQLASRYKLEPLLTVLGAPMWAQSSAPHPTSIGPYPVGPFRPDPAQFGLFAHALALRYGGSFQGLPRVRYWEIWDEPNLMVYLSPQIQGKTLLGADIYRSLVNAAADAIHSVHSDNLVAAGSLAPFSFLTPYGRLGVAPLDFMRRVLSKNVTFDAWSHHPYTSGGPTHHATERGDVSLGDLPELRRVLDDAYLSRHVISKTKPQLWVTEFSWDTKPPDTNQFTVPINLQARWTSEALYRMWQDGVTLVTWFLLRDTPYPQQPHQSGLYFMSPLGLKYDRPKPTLTAFRFPFVAYSEQGGVYVWGRTPGGVPARVVVERRTSRRWQRVAIVPTDTDGILSRHLKVVPPAVVRARPAPRGSGGGYRAAVLADSPAEYWQLDRTFMGASPEELAHSAARLQGGAAVTTTGGPIGRQGALSLNGKTASALLGPLASPQTVELWLKTRASAETPAFSNRNALHQYVFAGTWGGLADVFDGFRVFGTSTVNDGNWHQIVYTYKGLTGHVYVDGRLQGTSLWNRTRGSAPAYVGYDLPLKVHLRGFVGQLSIYNYALSPGRIAAHYVASGRQLAPLFERGSFRARLAGTHTSSLPFSLHRPPDRYVLPFGGGG